MRVLGIIPARAGSKRVVDKNVRMLAGKPLVQWAIDAATNATTLDYIVVSSDDPRVLAIAKANKRVEALERPQTLATDTALAIDYVWHALGELEKRVPAFDAVAIVQPSSPFTTATDIDATVNLLNTSNADSAVSVMKVDHAIHPAKLKRLEDNRLIDYMQAEGGRMAAHELPELYVRNCSVYVSRRSTLDKKSILGDDSRGYIMPRERSIDINDELDLAFAEFLFARRSSTR